MLGYKALVIGVRSLVLRLVRIDIPHLNEVIMKVLYVVLISYLKPSTDLDLGNGIIIIEEDDENITVGVGRIVEVLVEEMSMGLEISEIGMDDGKIIHTATFVKRIIKNCPSISIVVALFVHVIRNW